MTFCRYILAPQRMNATDQVDIGLFQLVQFSLHVMTFLEKLM